MSMSTGIVTSSGSPVAVGSTGGYTKYMPRKHRIPGQMGFKEAAAFLGVTESSFARLVREGEIERHRPPAGWPYYLQSELQEFLDRHNAKVEQEKAEHRKAQQDRG